MVGGVDLGPGRLFRRLLAILHVPNDEHVNQGRGSEHGGEWLGPPYGLILATAFDWSSRLGSQSCSSSHTVHSLSVDSTLICNMLLLIICRSPALGLGDTRATGTSPPSTLPLPLKLSTCEGSPRQIAAVQGQGLWENAWATVLGPVEWVPDALRALGDSPIWDPSPLPSFWVLLFFFFVSIKFVHSSCKVLMTGISFLPVPRSTLMQDNCIGSIHQQSCIHGKSIKRFPLTCKELLPWNPEGIPPPSWPPPSVSPMCPRYSCASSKYGGTPGAAGPMGPCPTQSPLSVCLAVADEAQANLATITPVFQ